MMQRLASVFFLLAAAAVQAHFVFVVPEEGGTNAKVILSETLNPDQQVNAGLVGGTKLSLRNLEGKETPLTLVKAEHTYLTQLPGKGTRLIHGSTDVGIMSMGADSPYLLLYYPKAIAGDVFDAKAMVVGESAPVEIVPLGKPGALTLRLLVRGKPHPNAEITVILPDGTEQKVATDETGQTEAFAQTGRYGAWARHWEAGSGEREGREYDQVRRYATLVLDAPPPSSVGSNVQPAAETDSVKTASLFATLPQATASFGAVASDGWLYIYGGHIAATHSYSTEAVSGRFDRLRLRGDPAWEKLPDGPAVQGMNLAAHGGKIYRIGGMQPRNRPGEGADNYSLADGARFDPATKQWEPLPPLPEPRSSHDVVVVGDQLIVTGGWTLAGANTEWMDTLAVMDLTKRRLGWESVGQPFRRRALMAAAHDGKMYVIGGINEEQEIVRGVSVYDPKSKAWSSGPELPKGSGIAFAPAAGVHNGRLYVSVSDGTLFRLDESGRAWEKAGSATPRVAHRLASQGDSVLVIGGASKGSNFDLIEAIPVGGKELTGKR